MGQEAHDALNVETAGALERAGSSVDRAGFAPGQLERAAEPGRGWSGVRSDGRRRAPRGQSPERQVPEQVEHLVPRTFVRKAQGVSDQASRPKIKRSAAVVRRPMPAARSASASLSVTNVRLEAICSLECLGRQVPRSNCERGSGHQGHNRDDMPESESRARRDWRRARLSPSRTTTELSSTSTSRIRSCSTMPACSNAFDETPGSSRRSPGTRPRRSRRRSCRSACRPRRPSRVRSFRRWRRPA